MHSTIRPSVRTSFLPWLIQDGMDLGQLRSDGRGLMESIADNATDGAGAQPARRGKGGELIRPVPAGPRPVKEIAGESYRAVSFTGRTLVAIGPVSPISST